MPELPEIEHLRRTLRPRIVGSAVQRVCVRRREFLRNLNGRRSAGAALLAGQTIIALHRHGKQLAIEGDRGGVVCLHLGMSGHVRHLERGETLPATQRSHVHCEWRLAGGSSESRMIFRDPRRFGGVWVYESLASLRAERWAELGPDALTTPLPRLLRAVQRRLKGSQRPVKAAMLDQSIIAGVGNIYADEACFRAGISPVLPAGDLACDESRLFSLLEAVRQTLRAALAGGGSTLRDYFDASGRSGTFVSRHLVYGRGGLPCVQCGTTLTGIRVAQRSTVFCTRCQPHPNDR